MKRTILRDLVEAVWKHLGKGKPSELKLVEFLCGMDEDGYSHIPIADSNHAHRIVSGDTKDVACEELYKKRHWDWRKFLDGEVDWQKRDKKLEDITKEIHAIYQRNIEAGYMMQPKGTEPDFDSMLHALMVSYVFSCWNTEEYILVMESPKIYTCENLIERKGELARIEAALESHGKTVVYGTPGIGKSQLVRDFIRKNQENYHEIYLAEFLGTFEKTIAEIGFQSYTENGKNETDIYKEKLGFLRNKNRGCLLVLDGIDNGREELERSLGLLGDFHMDIIIVTSQNCSRADGFGQDSRFSCIKIGQMDNDRLFELFKGNLGSDKRKLDKGELDKLFQLLENHTLSVCMAAKILRNEKQSVLWMIGKMQGSLTVDISDKKFKLPYENKQLTVRGHIKKLIHIQCKSGENMPVLKVLSMIARYKTDEEILIRWGAGKVTRESLCEAVSFCLMEREAHAYKMHNIIAAAIEELGKVGLPDMEENIKRIREDIQPGCFCRLNIRMVGNVLLTVSVRLNSIVEKEYKNKRYSKNRVRLWRQFVVESILFLMTYGNITYSKQVIDVVSDGKEDGIARLLNAVLSHRCAVLEGDAKNSEEMNSKIQIALKSLTLKQEQLDDLYGLTLIWFCSYTKAAMDKIKYDFLNDGYVRQESQLCFVRLVGNLNDIKLAWEVRKKQQCMYISSKVMDYYVESIGCYQSVIIETAGGHFQEKSRKLNDGRTSSYIVSLQTEMEKLYFSLWNLRQCYINGGISPTEYAEKLESVREYLEGYRKCAGQFPTELGISYHMDVILLNAFSINGRELIAALREANNYFKMSVQLSDNNFLEEMDRAVEEAIAKITSISSNFYKNTNTILFE